MIPAVSNRANAAALELTSGTVLAPGVQFFTFLDSSPRTVVNVVEILPGAPGAIKVVPASTTGGPGTASVAGLCAEVGAVACINADMFDGAGPLGGEVVDQHWLKAPTTLRQQLWLNSIGEFSTGAQPPGLFQSVGATSYNILSPGAPISIPEQDSFSDGGYARTLVGWNSASYRFFVTVEQGPGSAGVSLARAAELMQQFGASTAVNEDGGGSTQMVVRGRPYLAPGEPARPVANVLAMVSA
ncbi:MAG: phosphodiester glycosidase family protein [Acidimicrobiales bacterium]